jgi:hypothetical protein
VDLDPTELEQVAARELARLPAPRAPHTLLPRVLAAMAAEAGRPWYGRAWRTWPRRWQAASGAAVVAIAVGAAWLLPGALAAAGDSLAGTAWNPPAWLAGAAARVSAVWSAWQAVWRVVVQPVAPYVATFVLVLSAASVAFAAALDRVLTLGGVPKS